MSQHVELTDRESVALGRRIKEIVEEYRKTKGDAFSVRAFCSRNEISRYVLTEIIEGRRRVSPYELEIIARGLNLSVERVKRENTRPCEEELVTLVRQRSNLKRAFAIVQELLPVITGCTQRFEVLNPLGIIYYVWGQYTRAKEVWLEALVHAKKMKKDYNESEPLRKITENLIIAYSKLKDYAGLVVLLDELKPDFDDSDPEFTGTLYLSQAITEQRLGDMAKVRDLLVHSLDYFRLTGNIDLIGRGEHNIAYHEYCVGNYYKSKELFEQTITTLADCGQSRLVAIKEYVKVLLKLNERKLAVQWIDNSLQELEHVEHQHLKAQFLLLLTIATNDKAHAERVLDLENVGAEHKRWALKYLMNYCNKIGDAEGLMRYYKMVDEPMEVSAIFDGEGFVR